MGTKIGRCSSPRVGPPYPILHLQIQPNLESAVAESTDVDIEEAYKDLEEPGYRGLTLIYTWISDHAEEVGTPTPMSEWIKKQNHRSI